MKLWRKLAKKDPETGRRNGRDIAYQMRMSEVFSKQMKRSYPLLDALLEKSGQTYVLTNKQQEALKNMIKENETLTEEKVNETI
jgi:hypothetical protein